MQFFETNNLIHSSQIGFIKGFRTTDHIFSLRTLIDKYVVNTNKGKLYFAVLLIIKKRLIRYGMMLFYIKCLISFIISSPTGIQNKNVL